MRSYTYILFIVALSFAHAQSAHAQTAPMGTFDATYDATCQIGGWARDPDTVEPISIHIYRDGAYGKGGTFIAAFPARLYRPGLPFEDKNHGFGYTFEESSGLYDGTEHSLYAYAIDGTGDQNKELNGNPKKITCKNIKPSKTKSPEGTFDGVYGNTCEIAGWARDPDTKDPISIYIFKDGAHGAGGAFVSQIVADAHRSDLPFADKNHGFRYKFEANSGVYDGKKHPVFLYAVDATGDPNTDLVSSPKTITCEKGSKYPVIENGTDPYTVGAWYFTAWSSDYDGHILKASEGLYGRKDVWGGVRDHAVGADPQKLGVDYSDREPLLGFYDLSKQQVMDAHIQQAASRGLSYFAFYWYWDAKNNKESGISTPLKQFTTSKQKNKMRFVLAPAILEAPISLETWEKKVVPFMIKQYISDPSYLATKDGRPIIFDFGNWFTDPGIYAQGVVKLRQAVKKALNKDPLILLVASSAHSAETLQSALAQRKEDGLTCFNLAAKKPAESYIQTTGSWDASLFAKRGDAFYLPCAVMAYDPRPWWHVGYGWAQKHPNEMNYAIDITQKAFESHLKDVKQHVDSNPQQTSRTVTLYAWNEWGEGGMLEPSKARKYQYLDSVKKVFRLTSRAKEPAQKQIEEITSMLPSQGLVKGTTTPAQESVAAAPDADPIHLDVFATRPEDVQSSFVSPLHLDSEGEDVRMLQMVLLREGLLGSDLITGYFGKETHAAVVAFQERFSETILRPLDLQRGTGYAGLLTLQKARQLADEHLLD